MNSNIIDLSNRYSMVDPTYKEYAHSMKITRMLNFYNQNNKSYFICKHCNGTGITEYNNSFCEKCDGNCVFDWIDNITLGIEMIERILK